MSAVDPVTLALPGYDIEGELGRGSFGVVLGGRHRQLGRDVAIKQLAPALMSDPDVRSRFLAEAQILASIEHPHIVPVYDYVEREDACILVMEHLHGGTVWGRFVERGVDSLTACAIALVVCSALEGAHRHGVLHRDMKPENVLFADDHVLKVTDFGIARVLGEDDALATRDGDVLGTPAYMAPEQASGSDLGPATDVYATAVMLYELLSGHLPYADDGGALAIMLRHVNEDAVPLSDVAPDIPPDVAAVVMRALARAPADRYPSAEAFGVAVAEAAARAWGAQWLDRSGVTIREPGAIMDAAQHPTPAAQPASGATAVVHPIIELHTGDGGAAGIAFSDLMPLRRSPVEMPPRPRALIWSGVAVALLAVVLGLVGLGSSTPSPTLARGAVTVAGSDPAAGAPVHLNLDRPIPIAVTAAPSGFGVPVSAQLLFHLGGVTVVRSTTGPLVRRASGLRALVDASVGRYVVGGKLIATLVLTGSRGQHDDSFGVQVLRSPFATFFGIIGIVLLLIDAAYAESLMRQLRRGRRRDNRSGVVGMAIVGALGGADATLWGWMLGISAPSGWSFLIPAVVGAVAGLLLGLAGRRLGDRARVRRRSNRLVLLARRAPAQPSPQPVGAD